MEVIQLILFLMFNLINSLDLDALFGDIKKVKKNRQNFESQVNSFELDPEADLEWDKDNVIGRKECYTNINYYHEPIRYVTAFLLLFVDSKNLCNHVFYFWVISIFR